MIVLHTGNAQRVADLIRALGLAPLAHRGAVDVEDTGGRKRLAVVAPEMVSQRIADARSPRVEPPAVRIFLGAKSVDDCRDVLAASASPLGLRPAHDDRSMCLLLHRSTSIVGDMMAMVASRHAVITTIVEAAEARRLRLRWSDIGLLAARDLEGVRPAEPYTIDLDSMSGEVAWHWLRVLFRREPTALDMHHVAILQECERVADATERTTGMRHALPEPSRKVNLSREASLAASRLLGRRPSLSEVIGPPAWDESAARRYLVRQMTGG